jgi:hypothetical protein
MPQPISQKGRFIMARSSKDCAEDELGRLADSGSRSPRRRRAGWLVASIALAAGLPVVSQTVAAGSPAATKPGKAGKVTLYPGMDRPWRITTGAPNPGVDIRPARGLCGPTQRRTFCSGDRCATIRHGTGIHPHAVAPVAR